MSVEGVLGQEGSAPPPPEGHWTVGGEDGTGQ